MNMSDGLYSPWDNVGFSSTEEEPSLMHLIDVVNSTLTASLFKACPSVNSESVAKQLREYVTQVANNYHEVPFHSFRHAAQVFFNATYLVELTSSRPGTWSMPAAHAFCLLFSALIHDLDHRGMTNPQMIKQDFNGLFSKYPDGSLAEHNSIDVAFSFLDEYKYEDLRYAIGTLNFHTHSSAKTPGQDATQYGISSFKAMVTTLVLSTDIMNPQRTASSRAKWNEAFDPQSPLQTQGSNSINKKDEAVLEHLLQLADIGHCTQRWETFLLWNQRLLTELVSASAQGRGVDPSDGWFDGQMAFCSSYVIPLTERIGMSGIFSPDISHSFADGALRNKNKWLNEAMGLLTSMKEAAKTNLNPQILESDQDIENEFENSKFLQNFDNLTLSRLSLATTAPSSGYSGSLDSDDVSHRNIWSRLTHWSDVDRQREESYFSLIVAWFYALLRHLRSSFLTMKHHPLIPLISLLTFAVLCTLGLLFVKYLEHWHDKERCLVLSNILRDIGKSMTDAFDQALLPMFTLAQFIQQQSVFHSLPNLIDNRQFKNGSKTMRDVSGLCSNDQNQYSLLFSDIAEGILSNSNFSMTDLGRAVTDIRAVPYGVQCLMHPLTPSTASQIGTDWRRLSSNTVSLILQNTVLDNTMYTIGPFSRNYTIGSNAMNSREILCSHLAVNMPNYTFSYMNSTRPTWGFVMMFFDWTTVKENIGLDQQFQSYDLGYYVYGNVTSNNVTNIFSLANSSSFDSLKQENIVTSSFGTSYGEWVIEAGYLHRSDVQQDLSWLRAIMVCASFALSFLLLLSLIARQKHKDLLYKMMPPSAIRKIGRGDTVIEKYDLVTIFFCDIVGFTTMAGEMTPLIVMEMLNDLYSHFDKLTVKHHVYKVETIGDCFMAVGGAPQRCTAASAAQNIALFALDVLDCVNEFLTRGGEKISVRVGLASGSVVAGVVGNVMPRYCFFGDTVNLASRMESTSRVMRIQCTDLTYQLLQSAPDFKFHFEERRDGPEYGVFVKGKGHVHTWWITGSEALTKGDP